MSNPLELSLSDSFNRERFTRSINACNDVKDLQALAVLLLNSWLAQKAATQWTIRQAMAKPVTVSPESLNLSAPSDCQ